MKKKNTSLHKRQSENTSRHKRQSDSQEPINVSVEQDRSGVMVSSRLHVGPMPSPETMAKYEHLYPGAAKHFFVAARSEQQSRHAMTEFTAKAYWRATTIGQMFGFFLAVAAIGGGVFIATYGNAANAGSVLASTGAIGLISAFIYGKKSDNNAIAKRLDDDGDDDQLGE